MLKLFKTGLTAVMLSSVAALPLAAVVTGATADAAYAKGKKEKKEKPDRQARRGGPQQQQLLQQGKGGGKGKGKAKKLASAPVAATANVEAEEPVEGEELPLAELHARDIGNMNGALHASPNAIAAHMRNGNTNGPVGLMAAYVAARGGAAAVAELPEGSEEYAVLDGMLEEAGYDSYADYDGENEEINAYLEGMGEVDGEMMAEVESANDAFGSEAEAQDALVAFWNKGGDSELEADLATEDALRAMLEARAAEIAEAESVQELLPEPAPEVVDEPCDAADPECVPPEEEVVVLE